MKIKTFQMSRSAQTKVPDWLFFDDQEDDFLLGKDPLDLQETLEDDE